MNERIKELAGQACDIMPLYDSINRGDYTHSQYNMQIELLLEKFAELIVKECTNVIRQEWFDENNTKPEQDSRSIAIHVGKKLGIDSVLNAVTKHFGVE